MRGWPLVDLIGSWVENRREIHSRIGTVSFRAVCKGLDRLRNRPVALKTLDPRVQKRNRESAARFRREASTLCRLRHENVMRLLDVKEASGIWLLILEYLEGDCLSDWAEGRNHLLTDVRAVLGIVRQVAEGLDHTRRRGVLHRDIKPSNTLVLKGRPQGETGAGRCPCGVKILDFGLARLIDYGRPRKIPTLWGASSTCRRNGPGCSIGPSIRGRTSILWGFCGTSPWQAGFPTRGGMPLRPRVGLSGTGAHPGGRRLFPVQRGLPREPP